MEKKKKGSESKQRLKPVKFKLPKHLVEALNEMSKSFTKSSDEFLTWFLETLYQVWLAGKNTGMNINKIEELKKRCMKNMNNSYSYLANHFNNWLNEQGIAFEQLRNDSINVINNFLIYYSSVRQLKQGKQPTQKTLDTYKRELEQYCKCLIDGSLL